MSKYKNKSIASNVANKKKTRSTMDEINLLAASDVGVILDKKRVTKKARVDISTSMHEFMWLEEECNESLLTLDKPSTVNDASQPEALGLMSLRRIDRSVPLVHVGNNYYCLNTNIQESDITPTLQQLPKNSVFFLSKNTPMHVAKKALFAIPRHCAFYLNTNNIELARLVNDYGLPLFTSLIIGKHITESIALIYTLGLSCDTGVVYESLVNIKIAKNIAKNLREKRWFYLHSKAVLPFIEGVCSALSRESYLSISSNLSDDAIFIALKTFNGKYVKFDKAVPALKMNEFVGRLNLGVYLALHMNTTDESIISCLDYLPAGRGILLDSSMSDDLSDKIRAAVVNRGIHIIQERSNRHSFFPSNPNQPLDSIQTPSTTLSTAKLG